MMIVSIGLSIFLRNVYQYFAGGEQPQLLAVLDARAVRRSARSLITPQGRRRHRCSALVVLVGDLRRCCSAPGSGRRPGRSPTTRRWPPPPASTSSGSSRSSGSAVPRSPACPACCSGSPRASTTSSASRSCCWSSPPSCSAGSARSGAPSSAASSSASSIEVSTLFVPAGAQVRRRPGRADRRPAGPTARPARPSRAGRLREKNAMDWNEHLQPVACSRASARPPIVYCLAAIGLNVHFGYTGLLNFGQAGFMAVAGYALASIVATWGLTFWLGIVVGLLLTVAAGAAARCPDAAAAGRLPRDRDDRGRGDHPADRSGRSTPAGVLRRPGRPPALHRHLRAPEPVQRAASASPGVVTWRPYDFWVMTVGWIARRAVAAWSSAC